MERAMDGPTEDGDRDRDRDSRLTRGWVIRGKRADGRFPFTVRLWNEGLTLGWKRRGLASGLRGSRLFLALESRAASPRHCRLWPHFAPGADRLQMLSWSVEDLGSETGTHVNGLRIRSRTLVALKAGDRLRLGSETDARRGAAAYEMTVCEVQVLSLGSTSCGRPVVADLASAFQQVHI